VLRAPEHALLTTRSALREPSLAAAWARLGAELQPKHLLATHLLHELSKRDASRFRPYLQQLPVSFTSLANFPAAAAEALQLSQAVELAEDAAEACKREWRAAQPLLQAPELGESPRATRIARNQHGSPAC
jgi:hypothetical protein